MGLLDGGVARAFAQVFGGVFQDALLHPPEGKAETKGGSVTVTRGEPVPVKVQKDAVTAEMRAAEGHAEQDVRFIILTGGANIGLPESCQGFHLTYPAVGGTRYSLQPPASLDAAGSHVQVRGRPVRSAVP